MATDSEIIHDFKDGCYLTLCDGIYSLVDEINDRSFTVLSSSEVVALSDAIFLHSVYREDGHLDWYIPPYM